MNKLIKVFLKLIHVECLPPKMFFTGKTVINTDYLTYLLPDAQTTSYIEEGTDHL